MNKMFYCDPCADKYYYAWSFFKSLGKCELCGNMAICNEYPSAPLPSVLDYEDSVTESSCSAPLDSEAATC
jgi:hypothetical protein